MKFPLTTRLYKRNTDPAVQKQEPKVVTYRSSGLSANHKIVRTAEEAMLIPAVYRCVGILSGTIASMPLRVKRAVGNIFQYDEINPLNDLFNGIANERQTFYVLLENAIRSIHLRGNAYILPQNGNFYLLNPNCVSYNVQSNKYYISDPILGITSVREAYEIIHLKNTCMDGGYIGLSTIEYAYRTLSVSASADEQTLDGLRRGNKLKGMISGENPAVEGIGTTQDRYLDDVRDRLVQEVDEDKSIMRLPGAIKFTPLSITPADAQLLETRKFSPYDICRFFGVHPDMVFIQQSSNYKASENSQITFLNQTLTPLLSQIEAEFKAKLIRGSQSTQSKYKIEFDRYNLSALDIKTRSEYVKTSIESGVMTPNEARASVGMPPVDGGDTMFISCNVAPIKEREVIGGKNATSETLE